MTTIAQSVAAAQQVLAEAFGSSETQNRLGAQAFLEETALKEAYGKAMETGSISQFDGIQKSIDSIRSTYLPFELVNMSAQDASQRAGIEVTSLGAMTSGTFASIADDLALSESHENAFMRMLGMPLSDEASISISTNISVINSDGSIEEKDINDVIDILDQRQLSQGDREVRVNLDEAILSLFDKASVNGSPDLTQLESEFFKFSHLLLPPVQDGRISKCINETKKIVAPAFSGNSKRMVNRETLRPGMIESIIKIRLDRATGTTSFSSDDSEISSDEFGILESLFILRLRSSLGGLAKRFLKAREGASESIQRHKRIPVSSTGSNDGRHGGDPTGVGAPKSDEQQKIEAQISMGDAILTLLADHSEIQAVPGSTGSSIENAHMIGGLVDLIRVPDRANEKRLKEMSDKSVDSTTEVIEPLRTTMSQLFGTQTGVGLVDIAVFSLALFTISEEELVGLLSTEQFNTLKTGSLGSLLPGSGEKMDTVLALNALTTKIKEGYDVFLQEVREDLVAPPAQSAESTEG